MKKQLIQKKTPSKYRELLATLQKSVFHGSFHATTIGVGVATFWLLKLNKNEVENRVERILNTPAQNQVDYLALLCSMLGIVYGWILQPYDPNYDPFVQSSLLEKRIFDKNYKKLKRRIDQIEESAEEDLGITQEQHDSLYKVIFSCSWLNPQIRHVLSFACIGVGTGVVLHFLRTRNVVQPERIMALTTDCRNM